MKLFGEKSVAVIVAAALIGLISVQAYWARRTYNDAETAFNDKILRILTKVRDQANDVATCFVLYSKTYIDSSQGIYLMKSGWQNKNDVEAWDSNAIPDSIPMFFDVPEEYKNSDLNRVYKDIKFSNPVTAEIFLKFRYDINKSSPDKKILSQNISTDNFKEAIKNHEALLNIYDTLMIDSLIRYQIKSNNMAVDYSYAMVKTNNDSVEYSSLPALNTKILHSGIRIRLTPDDLFSYPYDIIFYSPSKAASIFKNIIWVLSLSACIILLLLFGFAWFLRTILRQKKLSEMKNDFINNMTHEFNTPIANISLAYETLRDKGKIATDENSNKIIHIIQAETERLKDNVTRILKISSFEGNGIELSKETFNAAELLTSILQSLDLRIKQKNACVNISEPGIPANIYGDKLHLSNVFENLIENALKYCNGSCAVDITISKQGTNTIIEFKDNGIGMNKDELDKIFEKFYRVQHGNIQNDRGFGLGLNYVKKIIDAHGGKICVTSKPGSGSCFKIILN